MFFSILLTVTRYVVFLTIVLTIMRYARDLENPLNKYSEKTRAYRARVGTIGASKALFLQCFVFPVSLSCKRGARLFGKYRYRLDDTLFKMAPKKERIA